MKGHIRGTEIRWLKMLLAEPHGAHGDPHRKDMRLVLEQAGCTVPCAATLLVAYFIREATKRAQTYYAKRGSDGIHFSYNVGAPLQSFAPADAIEDSTEVVSDKFLRAAFWAQQLIGRLPSGNDWDLRLVIDLFKGVAAQHPQIPAEVDRNVFIVPETHAVVAGAVDGRTRLEPGNYVVIDVGAGTTDVAVFLFNSNIRKDDRQAVTYLADPVKHEASARIDRCIAEITYCALCSSIKR